MEKSFYICLMNLSATNSTFFYNTCGNATTTTTTTPLG